MKNRYKTSKKLNKFADPADSGYFLSIIVIFAIFVLGFGSLYLYFETKNEMDNIDANYCRKNPTPDVTVILIDHSDKLNTIQRASLELRLVEIARAVPKNTLLKVYSIGNTTEKPLEPVFEKCNPGDETTVNDYTGNKKFTKEKYEDQFKSPINEKLNEVIKEHADNESPIMESLQSIAVTSFIGEKNKIASKKLYIVSDLLQNSTGFTLYNNVPDFNTFRNSSYWKSIKTDLSDVEIHILSLNSKSASYLQTPRLLKFWQEYFKEQNTRIRDNVPIEG